MKKMFGSMSICDTRTGARLHPQLGQGERAVTNVVLLVTNTKLVSILYNSGSV